MNVIKHGMKTALLVLLASLVVACATQNSSQTVQPQPLRVGITPDYPPVIFRSGSDIAGIEAELANQLGGALNRPVQFVEMPFDNLIPALVEGETDIIMSGMSVTDARRVRISFAQPYLKTGLSALVRGEDFLRFKTSQRLLESGPANIGIQQGTTGEAFAQQNFPNSPRISIFKTTDAPFELRRGTIDAFITDTLAVMWLASENEGEMVALGLPSEGDTLAWGVRRDDPALLNSVNAVLAGWNQDGTLNRILGNWIATSKPSE